MSCEDDFESYLKRFQTNRTKTIDSLKANKIHFAHTHQSFDAVPLELKRLPFPRARFQDKEILNSTLFLTGQDVFLTKMDDEVLSDKLQVISA